MGAYSCLKVNENFMSTIYSTKCSRGRSGVGGLMRHVHNVGLLTGINCSVVHSKQF